MDQTGVGLYFQTARLAGWVKWFSGGSVCVRWRMCQRRGECEEVGASTKTAWEQELLQIWNAPTSVHLFPHFSIPEKGRPGHFHSCFLASSLSYQEIHQTNRDMEQTHHHVNVIHQLSFQYFSLSCSWYLFGNTIIADEIILLCNEMAYLIYLNLIWIWHSWQIGDWYQLRILYMHIPS